MLLIPIIMKRIVAALVIASLFISGFSMAQSRRYELLIKNANIVDAVNNRIIPNKLLAIAGDTIVAIDETSYAGKYKADHYVDLAGKYVLPGLWDMHVHFRGGEQLIEANKRLLPLFLYYGVTTVRECGGDISPSVLEWKNEIAQGILAGPKIYCSGSKIDGPGATWAGSLEVVTADQIAKALDSLQKIKVDFVKIYDSRISREAFLETITEAEKRGMKTTGHMPYTVSLKEAVDRGLDGSEHMFFIFKACSSKEDSITNSIIQSTHTVHPIGMFAAIPMILQTFDSATANQMFRYFAEKKLSLTPTLYIGKVLDQLAGKDHAADNLLQYIDPGIQATYAGRVAGAKRMTVEARKISMSYEAKANALIPAMYRAGINILAGSDCGAYNSYVYPGESLHEEMKQLVESGLTAAQAIQSATINGAKWFGVEHFYGSIQAGKSADILVLDANPLKDIRAIDHIYMVHSNRNLYFRSDLEQLLESVKN